jgi:D-alanyl-D-alanine carboxypeptidase
MSREPFRRTAPARSAGPRIGAISAFLALLVLASPSARAEAPTADQLHAIRDKVATHFKTLNCPGAVFGVYAGADLKPLVELELGFADEAESRPISLKDHFRLASITKLFVGTVVLQLVDAGQLRLDDPVSKYVPQVPNGENITIRMLGFHTSGLANLIANREFQKAIAAEPSRTWRTDELLKYAFDMKPLFPPGKGWMYSNTNTIVLGEVIAKVTGHPWYEEIEKRILKPLKLRETGHPSSYQLPAPAPSGYRYGQKENLVRYGDVWYDATKWSASWAGAAGDLYGTLPDLAKFTRAAGRGELVSAGSRKVLFDWIDTKHEGIEYGFHIARIQGGIGSLGDMPGFSAFAFYIPESDVTVVCLANLTATIEKRTVASELGEPTMEILTKIKAINEEPHAKPK